MRVQRDAGRRSARRRRRRRRALGRARLRELQAQGGSPATTSPRSRPCARRVGPQARIRVDANGVWSPSRPWTGWPQWSPSGWSSPSSRRRTSRSWPWSAARRRSRSRPTRASPTPVTPRRAVELGCLPAGDREAGQGRAGSARRARSPACCPSTCPAPSTDPVGIAAAAHWLRRCWPSGTAAGLAHGLATQLLFAATIASVECELRDGVLHLPDGPGLGVEIDERALGSGYRLYVRRGYRWRRWTPPIATPRSRRHWSRSSRAAAFARPRLAPGLAVHAARRWPCGDSPRSRWR